MSLTRIPSSKKTKLRKKSDKMREAYLKNGGEVTLIETGRTTAAATMKFKYRKKRVKEEE